jgi:hypothetical protein
MDPQPAEPQCTHKRLTAVNMIDAAALDVPDVRDGPTSQFRFHHDVIGRAGTSGGKRVRSRLEKLLVDGAISPQESQAGLRFAWSYAVGCNPGVRSCLGSILSGGGGGGGGATDTRHQAFVAYDEARKVLDGRTNPQVVGSAPSNVLTRFCVFDISFNEIAEEIGSVSASTVRRRIPRYLATLAEHYAEVDRKRGRSTTAQTRADALNRFDPSDRKVTLGKC